MSDLNKSGVVPLGRAVIVMHYEPVKKEASLIQLPDTVKDRTVMVEQRVRVVAIGPDAWVDSTPRAVVGDHVFITKFAGYMLPATKDGERYRIINDNEIFAKIVDEGMLQ